MKSTGIIRRIDDLGRVVIPKEIRRNLLLNEGDPLELFVDGDFIKLKKYVPDYNFYDMLNDLERRFNLATDIVGHRHTEDIKLRLKEVKELWMDC